jgi:hypothetical protein
MAPPKTSHCCSALRVVGEFKNAKFRGKMSGARRTVRCTGAAPYGMARQGTASGWSRGESAHENGIYRWLTSEQAGARVLLEDFRVANVAAQGRATDPLKTPAITSPSYSTSAASMSKHAGIPQRCVTGCH